MDLLALADFNLVAHHGGFGKAARASNRPKATLSRRVADLEDRLKLRLFERGGRSLKLTQEGSALYARTSILFDDLEETVSIIASGNQKPQGKLRISSPLLFSQIAMGKLAAGFALKYPEIQLEITTEDRIVDMKEEGYDLVIRVNPNVNESLIGRPFLRDHLVVVASPNISFPTNNNTPIPTIVRSATKEGTTWDITNDDITTSILIEPVLQLSSVIMVRDAVRSGLGIACLPISLVAHDIKAGRLQYWGTIKEQEIALWALYPSKRLLNVRVSAFLRYLKEVFPLGNSDELASFIE